VEACPTAEDVTGAVSRTQTASSVDTKTETLFAMYDGEESI